MKRAASIGLAVFCCVCLAVGSEQRAYAYVDPGSGLMVIQSAASVAAAVGYFFRRKIKDLFGGKQKSEVAETPAPVRSPAKRATRRIA
jgi:hypothetical protein